MRSEKKFMDNLALINSSIPLKSIPKNNLEQIIMGDFLDWVCNLLSIKEDGVEKLYHALPALQKHCWSMGFDEIRKMLTMYADGELTVKPTNNHLDRIKLGEIMNAYRQQKPRPKPLEIENTISEEEKKKILEKGVKRVYTEFLRTGKVPNGSGHIYETLYESGKLPPHTKEYRDAVLNIAVRLLKVEAKSIGTPSEVKKQLNEIKNKRGGIKSKCKEVILESFFKDCKIKEIPINDIMK